jgi:PAS domain S-box-containing protein
VAALPERDQPRDLAQRVAAAEEAAEQALPADGEQSCRGDLDLLVDRGRAHADDRAAGPRSLEARSDESGAPGRFERVVHADASGAFEGGLHHVDVVRVDRVGGPDSGSGGAPRGDGIGGEDPCGPGEAGPLHDRKPDPAQSEHENGGAFLDARSVEHRPDPRLHRTADQTGDVEREIGRHPDRATSVDHRVLGECRDVQASKEGRPAPGEARAAVLEGVGDDAATLLAQARFAADAPVAGAARGARGQHDRVAERERRHSGADRVDLARGLVTEDDRERRGHVAVHRAQIRMTDPAVTHPHADLAGPRLAQLDVVAEDEGLALLFEDRGAHSIPPERPMIQFEPFEMTSFPSCRQASIALLWVACLTPALAGRAEDRPLLKRTILVAVDRAYPPHQFVSDAGEPAGFDVELFRVVAASMGLRYDMRLGEWPEIREALETGAIDVNPGVFFTEARAEHLAFTVHTVKVRHTLFVRSGSPVREVSDVFGRQVLMNRGGLHDDMIRERDLPIEPLRTRDSAEAIARLAAGEGDAAVVLDTQGLYFLRRDGIENVHSIGRPLDDDALRFAVPRGQDALLAALNDGLARVRDDGSYDALYDRWFGVLQPEGVPPDLALRWLGAGVGVVALAAGLGLLWTRTLKRRVARASQQLLESDARLRATLTAAPGVAFVVTDGAGDEAVIAEASAGAERMIGLSREELLGRPIGSLRSAADFQRHATLAPAQGEERRGREAELMRSGGSAVPVFVLATRLPEGGLSGEGSGDAGRVLLVLVDLSERVRGEEERQALERRIQESEKLEALGRLSGSVAHDFNNLLMVVQSTFDALRDELAPSREAEERLSAVDVACDTAAQLVRQLQTFGGSEESEALPLTWNDVVLEIEALLRGSLPATIRLDLRFASGLWAVRLDPVEARQVVLNLVLNARDAIAGRGTIEVATSNRVLGGAPMALLEVRDDGRGMSDNERARGFEPFFTTRGDAGGTGLGLATVQAVVRRAGGRAEIDSEPERGTRVRVALPRAPKTSAPVNPPPHPSS